MLPLFNRKLYRFILPFKISSNFLTIVLFCVDLKDAVFLFFKSSKVELVLNGPIVKGAEESVDIVELVIIVRANELRKGRYIEWLLIFGSIIIIILQI